MNDWPADPKLDASLRGLVHAELIAARTDAIGVSGPKPARRGRQQVALGGVGLLTVVAVVVSLALRGTHAGGTGAGQPGASDATVSQTTPSPTPTLSHVATPLSGVTPVPKATTMPISTQSASPWFRAAGSMIVEQPVSTLLADGRVLFVGGYDQVAGFVTVSELYDPASGKFSPTGSITTARASETVTRLQDGRVLVVGGLGANGQQLASAELYDPATGKFTPTGSLQTARQFHTATLLPDGRVLIAGGYNTNPVGARNAAVAMAYHPGSGGRSTEPPTMTAEQGVLASAELYDPATGMFTATGSLNKARDNHTATLLSDGRVLVFGGGGEASSSGASAELYDPGTGKFSPTGSAKSGRWLHTATLLSDGRVLVTGGRASDDSIYATAEVYDPKSGKFTATGSMSIGRQEHSATLLPDGRVLVAGGFSGSGLAGNAVPSTELYDPKTGKFAPAGTMTIARMDQTASLLSGGQVLIAGGIYIGPNGWLPITTAELYQP